MGAQELDNQVRGEAEREVRKKRTKYEEVALNVRPEDKSVKKISAQQ